MALSDSRPQIPDAPKVLARRSRGALRFPGPGLALWPEPNTGLRERLIDEHADIYFKGLDLESRGEFRSGACQELARGFGVRDCTALLGNDKANEVRLMTATEFGKKLLRSGE